MLKTVLQTALQLKLNKVKAKKNYKLHVSDNNFLNCKVTVQIIIKRFTAQTIVKKILKISDFIRLKASHFWFEMPKKICHLLTF